MSAIKPESVFDQVSRLECTAKVLEAMEGGGSVSFAVNSALADESMRKSIERNIKAIERHYDISFLVKGGKNANVLSTDQVVRAILPEFKETVGHLVREKESLLNLKTHKPQAEVSIGTWSGIAMYLVPAVLLELTKSLGDRFDLNITQGDTVDHFRKVVSHRLDVAILPSGDKRAKQLRLKEIALNYRMQEGGIVFQLSSRERASPFPELASFVSKPRTFTPDKFVSTLRSSPLSMVHRASRTAEDDFDPTMRELFQRESFDRIYDSSGQRFRVPTYRHDRLLVRLGLSVGYGDPPRFIRKRVKLGSPDFEVLVGTDNEKDDVQLAYFPPHALRTHSKLATPLEQQTFSMYLRDDYNKRSQAGGLSIESAAAIKAIKDICNWDDEQPPAPWLTYSRGDSGSYLIHDVMQIESLM